MQSAPAGCTGKGLPSPEHQVVLDQPPDHFIHRDGVVFAGTHVIIDLWRASRLDDLEHMESVLRQAIDRCGATLLHIHLHHFTPTGISGVAVLAESHISVHTWPERGFAAFDVFMCGNANPELAVPIFQTAFATDDVRVRQIRRGETDAANVIDGELQLV